MNLLRFSQLVGGQVGIKTWVSPDHDRGCHGGVEKGLKITVNGDRRGLGVGGW